MLLEFRLLVDFEAILYCQTLSRRDRLSLFNYLQRLSAAPDRLSIGHEYDATGRLIDIGEHEKFVVHYWFDFPDRQIKVLLITRKRK